MTMRDHYLTKAAEFHARARQEPDERDRREFENLAKTYTRLAEESERNMRLDVSHRRQSFNGREVKS